jgi:hypothetical protein
VDELEKRLREIVRGKNCCEGDETLAKTWHDFEKLYRDRSIAEEEFIKFFTQNKGRLSPELLSHFRISGEIDKQQSPEQAPQRKK